jgi:tRNA pseudouridine38-40 synthase
MRNIRLIIEYDGTGYAGWQVQKDLPTIQGSLVNAIKELTGEEVVVSGASRTDAGVHALAQTANFQTTSSIPERGIQQGLNSILPGEIVIKEVSAVPHEFDSRRDSKGKTYLYKLINRPYPSALLKRYSWFVFKPLNVELMKEATRFFIGEKDFSSFRAADSDAPHSIREVTSFEIFEKDDGLIEFEVKGTAFLRHMVRIMVGTAVTVGKGSIKPEDVTRIIEARDRTQAPMTAPPQGLFLTKVEY